MTYFTDKHHNINVHLIPCRKDNYSYVVELSDNEAVIFDPCEKSKVYDFIITKSLKPICILLTHHHFDHVDGVEDLQTEFNIPIYCSEFDSKRGAFDGEHRFVTNNQILKFKDLNFLCLSTPGHTQSHISYYLPQHDLLFCGDTLFSLGCGRVFEPIDKIYEIFFDSMQKIKNTCNKESFIYCAHEYTLNNLEFLNHYGAISKADYSKLKALLLSKKRTIPSKFDFELKYNSFLNASSPQEFKKIREAKNLF